MVRHRFLSGPQVILLAVFVGPGFAAPLWAQPAKLSGPGRIFAASAFSIDRFIQESIVARLGYSAYWFSGIQVFKLCPKSRRHLK